MSGILHLATDKLTFKVEVIQDLYTIYPNLNTLMIYSFDITFYKNNYFCISLCLSTMICKSYISISFTFSLFCKDEGN